MQSPEKEDYITSIDNGSMVIEAYNKLHQLIQELNSKVENVIDKHEGEFLIAYQSHIRKIKYELSEMKKKSDEQENELKKNDRVYFLEKQIVLFREEALKLYDRLDEKTQESEILKIKCKDLEKTCFITQKQIREITKNKKMMETKLMTAESRVLELEEEVKNKTEIINRMATHTSESNTRSVMINNLNTRLKEHSKGSATQKINVLSLRKKSASHNDSELKDWFLECVRAIKKDVAYRKNSGYQFDLSTINSIDEFKMVDKLKLLEKFMENQKLLTWMYEKIFPSRLSEVRDYLSQRSLAGQQRPVALVEQQENIELFEKQDISLPKMSESRRRKTSQVRNRVSIKQGKLNLTAV